MLPHSKHIKSRTALIRQFLLFVLVSLVSVSSAQGGFNRDYYLSNCVGASCRNVIECPGGNLLMSGFTFDTLNNKVFNRLTLMGATPSGTVLWRKDYGGPSFIYLTNILYSPAAIYTTQTVFYQVNLAQDSAARAFGTLIKFDYNGDTIWQKIYRDPVKDLIPHNFCPGVDQSLLITGVIQNWTTNSLSTLLLKTDLNGNELWRREIHKASPDLMYGYSIIQDTATKRILITSTEYLGSGYFSNLLVLDSLGNQLFNKTFNKGNGGGGIGFGCTIQLRDKNFITGGCLIIKDSIGTPFVRGMLVKFDINGDTIWSKLYERVSSYNCFTSFLENNNGDIVILGLLNTDQTDNSSSTKSRILKTDANGNLKFARYVGKGGTPNTGCGGITFNRTSDGGFLIASIPLNPPNRTPFTIIKIDSTACDSSETYCKFEWEVGISSNVLDLGLRVFPNPANDHIIVKCLQTSQKNLIVKILDLSGRLVLQRNIFSEETSIDLSDLASGLYQVSVLQNEHLIETKKLVIER